MHQDLGMAWEVIEVRCRQQERMPTQEEIQSLIDRGVAIVADQKDEEIERLKRLIEDARRAFDECSAQCASMLRDIHKVMNT